MALKKITTVDAAESVSSSANLYVEDSGAFKRITPAQAKGLLGVDELKSAISEIDNVINETVLPTNVLPGYISATGVAGSSEAYHYCDYIDVSGFKLVSFSTSFVSNIGLAFYMRDRSTVTLVVNSNNCAEYGYSANAIPQKVVFDVPDNTKYLRFSRRNVYGVTAADFAVAGLNFSGIYTDVESLKSESSHSVKKQPGKNHFNPATAVPGYISNNRGTITAAASYKTTDYIDVSDFSESVCVSPKLRDMLQYDEDFGYISDTYISTTTVNAVVPINENAKYVRVSYWATDENSLQIEDGTAVSSYEPFEEYVESDVNCLNTKTREAVEELLGANARNVLYGKKWIPFGDSFTDYTNKTFDSGVYSGKSMSYPRLIALRNGMTIDENFFLSGRTMAYPADGTFTNSATCPTCAGYYQNVPADADYVTIMLGINDLNHQNRHGTTPDGEDATGVIALGTIDDTTTETYCGAYNTVLSWLRENRPFVHVGIIVTNGTQSQGFTEAQIALAKKWGYPYINLNGDERTPAFIRCYNPDMPTALKESLKTIQGVDAPSNTHPNWQTHELESTIIEAWLRSL